MFRALGGDPGVGTYVDGAYSVDLGIASTDNGLYDVERIEIPRGPQGTLYGRNSIGGAVNFITTKPSQDFAAEIRTLVGSYGMAEGYGFINGGLTDNISARLIVVNRSRDGVIKDLGAGEDLDSYEDENYTLALRWENENHTFDIRGNERSYGRIISSAQGAGLLTTSEYGGNLRRNDLMVHGYRPVDPNIQCSSLTDRTVANCSTPGYEIFTFNHKGLTRHGQFLVPGVDPACLQEQASVLTLLLVTMLTSLLQLCWVTEKAYLSLTEMIWLPQLMALMMSTLIIKQERLTIPGTCRITSL